MDRKIENRMVLKGHDDDVFPVKHYHEVKKQFMYVGQNNPNRDLYLQRTNAEVMYEFYRKQM